jgi:hypothetical protein
MPNLLGYQHYKANLEFKAATSSENQSYQKALETCQASEPAIAKLESELGQPLWFLAYEREPVAIVRPPKISYKKFKRDCGVIRLNEDHAGAETVMSRLENVYESFAYPLVKYPIGADLERVKDQNYNLADAIVELATQLAEGDLLVDIVKIGG